MLESSVPLIQKRSNRLALNSEDIIRMLRTRFTIPDNAKVFIHVPGGGDYSNMDLDVDEETPLQVSWETPE